MKKLTTILFFSLIIFFNSCGMELENKKDGIEVEKSSNDESKSEVVDVRDDFQDPSSTSHNTNTNVSVDVTLEHTDVFYEIDGELPSIIIGNKLQTHDEVVENTPENYKIPTRAELFDLVDSGDLDGFLNSNDELWIQDHNDDYAWMYSVSHDNLLILPKALDAQAIYILISE